jgi:hypothetical protein
LIKNTRKYEEAVYEYVIDLNKNMPEVYLMRAKNSIGLGKELESDSRSSRLTKRIIDMVMFYA